MEERDVGDTRHKCVPSSWAWNAPAPLSGSSPVLWLWATPLRLSLCTPIQTNCPPSPPFPQPQPQETERPKQSQGPRPGRHTCGALHSHSTPGPRPQIARRLYLEVCLAAPGNYKYGSVLPPNSPGWAGQRAAWVAGVRRMPAGARRGSAPGAPQPLVRWMLGAWPPRENPGVQPAGGDEEPIVRPALGRGSGSASTSHFLPWLPGASWLGDSCLASQ